MLLQSADPEQFNTAVEELTKSSLELSEAISNLGALKVMSGVFLAFSIVMIILFVWQVLSTSKKVDRVDKSMQRVEGYFDTAADKAIGNAQAQVMLRRAFNSLSQNVKYTVLRTRIENHIDNKAAVATKIDRLIHYEYSELVSFFSNFDYKDRPFSYIVDHEDAQLIIDFILEQVYIDKDDFSIATMDQATNILVNGLKLEYLKKL